MMRTEFAQQELPMFLGEPVALEVPEKPSLRPDEVARLLGCSKEHIRHLIEDGSLDAMDVRCAGTGKPAHRIIQTSVVRFMKNRRTS